MTVSNTPSNLLARYRVLFSGDVQGVGFRYTTLQLARRYPTITGYVRNLPSGQVSLVVEGKKTDIHQFLNDIQNRFQGYITETETVPEPVTGEFSTFQINR